MARSMCIAVLFLPLVLTSCRAFELSRASVRDATALITVEYPTEAGTYSRRGQGVLVRSPFRFPVLLAPMPLVAPEGNVMPEIAAFFTSESTGQIRARAELLFAHDELRVALLLLSEAEIPSPLKVIGDVQRIPIESSVLVHSYPPRSTFAPVDEPISMLDPMAASLEVDRVRGPVARALALSPVATEKGQLVGALWDSGELLSASQINTVLTDFSAAVASGSIEVPDPAEAQVELQPGSRGAGRGFPEAVTGCGGLLEPVEASDDARPTWRLEKATEIPATQFVWSSDSRRFFVGESCESGERTSSIVRLIDVEEPRCIASLELPWKEIDQMAISSEGLLIASRHEKRLWLLDRETLQVRREHSLPDGDVLPDHLGPLAFTASPGTHVAFFLAQDDRLQSALVGVDLRTGRWGDVVTPLALVHQAFERRDSPPRTSIPRGCDQILMKDDGRSLLCCDQSARTALHRFTVHGLRLEYSGSTPRTGLSDVSFGSCLLAASSSATVVVSEATRSGERFVQVYAGDSLGAPTSEFRVGSEDDLELLGDRRGFVAMNRDTGSPRTTLRFLSLSGSVTRTAEIEGTYWKVLNDVSPDGRFIVTAWQPALDSDSSFYLAQTTTE